MGTVTEIRRTVLPQELYDVVFAFMCNEITALHIIAERKDGISSYSFGDVPKKTATISESRGAA